MDGIELSKLNDWHKNNEIEVCSAFSTICTKVIKLKNKRRTPYEFIYNNKTYARFDSEDKARLYQDAFQEGASVGYYLEQSQRKPASKCQ